MNPREHSAELDDVRRQLNGATGKEYWRSLEELAQTPAFQSLVEAEFPHEEGEWTRPVSRRRFLTLMGASLALAGLSGCTTRPRETIMPYVRQPEEIVPGRPLYFATAMPLAGYGTGLLVESHMGRPIKVEGNPDHPASPRPLNGPSNTAFGPSHIFAQASTLEMYDPDRAQTVNHLGVISSWEAFTVAVQQAFGGAIRPRLRILTETVTSPTLASQIRAIQERYPGTQWHVHQPTGADNARIAARFAFGEAVDTLYRFASEEGDGAEVVLSLDADFLSSGPGHLRYVRDFTSKRTVRMSQPGQRMNRLYVVESSLTVTGAYADHRRPMRSSQVEGFARAVARELGINIESGDGPAHGVPGPWLTALVQDLRRHHGTSLVIAGEGQPPLVHALAHAINAHLGNVGRTVVYTEPAESRPSSTAGPTEDRDPIGSLRELAAAMARREVDVLLILGCNPAYDAPVDLQFAERMGQVPFLVSLGLYETETSDLCHWHVPEAHYLESWGDVRAYDGTVSLIQPLIAPLYSGRTASEVLSLFTGQEERSSHEIVRAYWRGQFARLERPTPSNFEAWWRKALHDGFVEGSASPPRTVSLRPTWRDAPGASRPASASGLEIVFRPDPALLDGRFANNGWLQEHPKPISKITWDNAIFMSPATTVRLALAPEGRPEEANQKVVRVDHGGRHVEGPVFVMPGHADDCVTLHLGYGRRRSGRVGTDVGFNAYALRASTALWFDGGAVLQDQGRRHILATTQHHHLMHNRDLVRSGTLADPPRIPGDFNQPRRTLSLYPERPWEGSQWGMSIDLTLCTGCSSCVVACQAENNIPVVGKEQVAAGREMHWLRVDSYFTGSPARPESLQTFSQPVPCMHCENAPCEVVCPVVATAHSTDGLNEMVYNRCVGTRYCSNNCPYKVRRFNFLQYADFTTESLRLLHNPDVTVRSRGVMEKCSYCVQRIRQGQIQAQLDDRGIRDGEVQTACQSACPAGAIVFGDLNARTKVAQLQSEPLNYGLLADLNTRPRTTYLAALKNPNPDITRLEERPAP